MSDSVRPHRRQPTRLLRPWDSPGKNTGVCCHFLLQCVKVKSESEVAQSCPTLSDPMDCSPPGSSVHGIFQARALEWGVTAFSCVQPYYGGFSCCGAQAIGRAGFRSCGSQALEHGLNNCGALAEWLCGRWDLPGSEIEPMSHELASGVFCCCCCF